VGPRVGEFSADAQISAAADLMREMMSVFVHNNNQAAAACVFQNDETQHLVLIFY